MKTTPDWLDAIKRQHKVTSDYAVAKLLGVAPTVVGHYRNGRRVMDNYACIQAAKLLDVDALKVIASAEAERARDAGKKDFWKRLAAGVLIAAGVGTGAATPAPAQASQSASNSETVCIMLNRRKRKKAVFSGISDNFALIAQAVTGIKSPRLA